MKFYQLVQRIDDVTYKPLIKFYDINKAKMRKKVYENTYPDKIFKIFVRKK